MPVCYRRYCLSSFSNYSLKVRCARHERAKTLTLGELDNKQNKYKDIAVQRAKCYEGHKEGAMTEMDRDSMGGPK